MLALFAPVFTHTRLTAPQQANNPIRDHYSKSLIKPYMNALALGL